ncbi:MULTISPECIES: metallophosphoesterase [unclassified Bradyrhizobium]|uniref:metallophosphoesterase family protein n=1 Tax=unclassified Bradyrhizobium TaxID=2631580 RepID=UPI001FF43CAD|nr:MULTISPECIES: metallophosphoesterase family protein [unclassified Bradyrhizobium]MCJ9706112.1 metallophosphatase family protein [Bradyrhizobium sp. SHOUNA76]MCJ9734497.1 metallophosphatase family protein [Bradyrhizobium sp. PRIMUS42]
MKFAAIADVHGNRPALEAVLADIAMLGIDEVVNLGDHVSGPLEAAATADLLIARGFPSVRGDQDRILVELWQAGGSARSDFRQLDRRHFEWLASMPATLMYKERVLLCHASPTNDAAFWLDTITADGSVRASPIEAVEVDAAGINAEIILCGHTHIARVVRFRDGRLAVNPGSVGLPGYDGKSPVPYVVEVGTPHACYAILEHAGAGWSATIRYVPYDPSAMAALARSKGMPGWASAIATGWVSQPG